jgi:fibronectin type 3 domain-containing protein
LTGGTQQFTGTVTGSTNTSINWAATGGTISSLGYYTAPSTAGTYTVTATSAADATKSASAAITVSAPIQHSVDLSWTASTSAVSGYNVYRSGQNGGPYSRINSALDTATLYADSTVQSGQTYYYVTTAADLSGNESAYSNQVTAVVPTP